MTTPVRIAQEVVELVVTQPVVVTVAQEVIELVVNIHPVITIAQEVVEIVYIETVAPGHIKRTGHVPTITYEIGLTPGSGHIIRTGYIPTITIDNPLARNEYNPRCILIEIDWVDDAQVLHTEYLSNLGYTTQSTDSPANRHYADLVIQAPVITARIDSSLQVGELTVRNPMQEGNAAGSVSLIDWANRAWHGHDIRLYVGDPTWTIDQFRLFFMGKIDNFSMDGDGTMTFSVADYGLLLQDAVTKTYGIYGKVFNMQPVYVGEGTSDTYRIDDINTGVSPTPANYNVCEITQVRDNGSIVAFTASADKKQFELNIPPAGTVTVDAIKSANYSAGRVITDIVTDLGYSTALIDLDSMNEALTGVGYVIGQNETISLMQIVQDISTSAGGFIQWDSEGKLRFYSIDISKAPKMDIGIDDMTSAGLQITSIDNPLFYLHLGYNRNWHVQEYNSLAGIAQIDSSPFTVEYQYLTQDNSKTVQYPLPMQQSIDTLIADVTDAQIEFNRKLAQRANRTVNFSVECFNLLTELVLGDNVTITYPKFNIDAMQCAITGVALNPNTNITSLSLWTPAEWIRWQGGLALFDYLTTPDWGATIHFKIDLEPMGLDILPMARAFGFASPELNIGTALGPNTLLQIAIGINAFDIDDEAESFIDVNLVKMAMGSTIFYQGLGTNSYATVIITNVDTANKTIEGTFTTFAAYVFFPTQGVEYFYTVPPPPGPMVEYWDGTWSNWYSLDHATGQDEYGDNEWNLAYHQTYLVPPIGTIDFPNDGTPNYHRVANRIRCETGGMAHHLYFKYLNANSEFAWWQVDLEVGSYIVEDGNFDLPKFKSYF